MVAVAGKSTLIVDNGNVHQLEDLRVKEDMLVERAKQLLDKEEALMSLERQLMAKQEALYWRERCLRSEQLAATTTTTTTAITTDTSSMPPLIQIHPGPPGIVGLQPPRSVPLERRRVTLMYQPDRQLQLQQMHAGKVMKHSRTKHLLALAPVMYLPTYCCILPVIQWPFLPQLLKLPVSGVHVMDHR